MVRSTRKGFTLVEIMIVVAIIGILIAIAVPGFLKARRQSRLNACQENQTKIDGAVQQLILERKYANLADTAAQTALAGTAWIGSLVGPDNYLRGEPKCPSGGTYTIFDADGGNEAAGQLCGNAVACSLWNDTDNVHVYACS